MKAKYKQNISEDWHGLKLLLYKRRLTIILVFAIRRRHKWKTSADV